MTLSEPQRRFLNRLRANGGSERTPFHGHREAGRVASAWYRTAGSLARMGLIRLERSGDAYVATLAEATQQEPGPRPLER